jgi:hypothetical protein
MVVMPDLLKAARKRLAGGAHGGRTTRPWSLCPSPARRNSNRSRVVPSCARRCLVRPLELRGGRRDDAPQEVGDRDTVAGLLAVLVPTHAWNALFLQGHGFWTTLENAMIGPIMAVLSWVHSIENVPLAAALWGGGSASGE